jgi:hypothetical protein
MSAARDPVSRFHDKRLTGSDTAKSGVTAERPGVLRSPLLVEHDDEGIVSLIAAAFIRSARFWEVVEGPQMTRHAASELMPCEGNTWRCVYHFVDLAREALAAHADSPPEVAHRSAAMRVLQGSRRLSWDSDESVLSTRSKHARFSTYVGAGGPIEVLECVLEQRCPYPGCDRPGGHRVKGRRERLKSICCLEHMNGAFYDGKARNGDAFYRGKVRDLLTFAIGIIDRAEAAGGQPLPIPSGLPVRESRAKVDP